MAHAHGEIVYNAKWMEMQLAQEAAFAHDLTSNSSRVVLATYENERYTLGAGWSARNLLPTDRPAWSNATGTEEVTRESVKLPSEDWEWEGDWQKDFQLRRKGDVDEDGWEYAHDFPRQYSRVRKWSAVYSAHCAGHRPTVLARASRSLCASPLCQVLQRPSSTVDPRPSSEECRPRRRGRRCRAP